MLRECQQMLINEHKMKINEYKMKVKGSENKSLMLIRVFIVNVLYKTLFLLCEIKRLD